MHHQLCLHTQDLNQTLQKEKRIGPKKNVEPLPRGRINLVMRSDKRRFARDGRTQSPNILVDDHPKNIREWEGWEV